MNTATLGKKLTQFADLKAEKKILEEQAKATGERVTALEQEIIADMCDMAENAGLDLQGFSVTIDGRRYGVIRKPCYSIKAEDRPVAFDAMRALGLGDLIVEQVNAQTLTKALNELAERNDGELPDEYSAIPMTRYDKDSISDRKVGR